MSPSNDGVCHEACVLDVLKEVLKPLHPAACQNEIEVLLVTSGIFQCSYVLKVFLTSFCVTIYLHSKISVVSSPTLLSQGNGLTEREKQKHCVKKLDCWPKNNRVNIDSAVGV